MTTEEIIFENRNRISNLIDGFNPLTGEGSLVRRFPFYVDHNSNPIYLPITLESEYKNVILRDYPNFEKELERLIGLRLKEDFEFWCYSTVNIKHKTKRTYTPFIANLPQRKINKILEDQRMSNKPIRGQLLKARQYGGSTDVQMYMAWIQLVHKLNWDSAIITLQDDQARTIRDMYSMMLERYPLEKYTLTGFQGSTKNKQIVERGCVQYIGSYNSPDAIRSTALSMAHLSEVGAWQNTDGKKPEDIIASISGTVPSEPYTLLILESTAKGQGNYFHKEWLRSEQGIGRPAIFVPWYESPYDLLNFSNEDEKKHFAETLDETGINLWESGASLEGINWYMDKLYREFGGNMDYMMQENPTTPQEAFMASGSPVFAPSYIDNIDNHNIKEPSFVGELFGRSNSGEDSLVDIRFEKVSTGRFSIWDMPNDPPIPEGYIFKGPRYVVILDLGGTGKKSDYSSISVIDRFWIAQGGKAEVAAEWHGKLDADLMAWKAAQVATFYCNAVLVIEKNTYDTRHQKTEGNSTYTVLDEIGDIYPNMYSSTPLDEIVKGREKKYGFHTNSETKPMVVKFFNQLLRVSGYIEKSRRAINEARTYTLTDKGKFEAVDGNHDDTLVTRMIGLWVACSSNANIDTPILEKKEKTDLIRKKPRINSKASF